MWRLGSQTVAIVSLLVGAVSAADQDRATAGDEKISFERHIRPILRVHCLDCHGAEEKHKGDLDLRLRRLIVKGGESGPGIVPGKPEESYLYERILSGEMPPGDATLTPEEIALFAKWISAGAPTLRDEPEAIGPGLSITKEDRDFWSFQPLSRPAVPGFTSEDRVRTAIDAFIVTRLQEKKLSFSDDASKRTLLRRATFDLIGLPPTPEETARFLADDSPEAYERLIDRLLASSRYGERWGRHWLDVAGYADSEGNTNGDTPRPYAYRYRDYVIRAFNADKPFDRFIQEQLAGDEMVSLPYTNLSDESIELLTATGFLRMAVDATASGAGDQETARNRVMSETIKIVSSALLGVTVGCAQCHDHRYDPIQQTDYYRMRAIFEPAYDWKNWMPPSRRRISLYTAADRAKASEIDAEAAKLAEAKNKKQKKFIAAVLEKELAKLDESMREPARTAFNTAAGKRTDEQKQIFKKHPNLNITGGNLYQYNKKASDEIKKDNARIASVRARKPVEEFMRVMAEVPGQIPETFLFHRGDHRQPKQKVTPAGLTITAPVGRRFEIPANNDALPTSGRRTAYARWLTSGTHPLVTRVLVNRVWMHHFGRGIVESPSDFGALGQKPTHPQLLDWLATEFVAGQWSMKRLHKLIMLSTVYRQSSIRDAEKEAVDPSNILYWRRPVIRLDAEVIRDSVLATSGAFTAKMFGRAVPVKEDSVGQIVVGIDNKSSANRPGKEIPLHGEGFRRSVYVQVRRSRPLAFLRMFDAPVMETNCNRRPSSTSSTQSLMLMNSKFIITQADQFARRLRRNAGDDLKQQLSYAWQLAYSRSPTQDELDHALQFVSRQVDYLQKANEALADKKKKTADPQLQAMTNVCQALLIANEFLYVD